MKRVCLKSRGYKEHALNSRSVIVRRLGQPMQLSNRSSKKPPISPPCTCYSNAFANSLRLATRRESASAARKKGRSGLQMSVISRRKTTSCTPRCTLTYSTYNAR